MANESILVIDDSLVSRKLIRVLLGIAGYEVRIAGDAEEALSVLAQFRRAASSSFRAVRTCRASPGTSRGRPGRPA
jgi:CheY-like chemotaxis protein